METGKQKSSTIDRKYHAILEPLAQWKRTAAWLCAIVGFLLAVWITTSQGVVHVSAGHLSKSHNFLDHDGCDKCHTAFVPIRSDSLGGTNPANVKRNNAACLTCHTTAGHFVHSTREEIIANQSCNTCHREHLGQDHNLTRIADDACVRCHSDLSKCSGEQGRQFSPATNFDSEHPKFAFEKLAKDPGTIRFSHRLHLMPGQSKSTGDGTAKRLKDLDKAHVNQYKDRVGQDGLIQLNCSDCHERDFPLIGYEALEQFDAPENLRLPLATTSHRLFKHVEFEKHCVACHSLDGIPHGLNKQQTEESIAKLLPIQQLEYFKTRGIPEKWNEQEISEREMRLRTMGANALNGCLKCHEPSDGNLNIAHSATESKNVENTGLTSESLVAPSNLKSTWLNHASFNHGSHLMVACKNCHPQAYDRSVSQIDSTSEADQIMLSGLDNCKTCHIHAQDLRKLQSKQNTHVTSADCIDCHRYHVDTPQKSLEKPTNTSAVFSKAHWTSWLNVRPAR